VTLSQLEAAPVGEIDIREAQRYCERLARREAKNFYWGFISLPHDQRMAIYALYGFARLVDDEADDPSREHRAERMDLHRERISALMHGIYDDPITRVLADAVSRFSIPERELQKLVDGCAMDLLRVRYDTWDELRVYCDAVASVVGRMCVRIFGFDSNRALQYADDLGLALQLTNILRDVREDAELGRIYLPQEDFARFGATSSELFRAVPGPWWDELVMFEVERAQALFDSGYRVLNHIPRRSAACVQTMAGIYHRLLTKIARDPRLPLRGRASLTRSEKIGVLVQSWLPRA
jgi:phytoene synthase